MGLRAPVGDGCSGVQGARGVGFGVLMRYLPGHVDECRVVLGRELLECH